MAYFSNGTEGEKLDQQCDECPLGQGPCPVFLVQMLHNYDQCDNEKLKAAMNLLIDERGICQVRPQLLRAGVKAPESNPETISRPLTVIGSMKEWAVKHGLPVASA